MDNQTQSEQKCNKCGKTDESIHDDTGLCWKCWNAGNYPSGTASEVVTKHLYALEVACPKCHIPFGEMCDGGDIHGQRIHAYFSMKHRNASTLPTTVYTTQSEQTPTGAGPADTGEHDHTGEVAIYTADGIWAGTGKVDRYGSVECAAHLGDEQDSIYDAIEEGIRQGHTSGTAGGYEWQYVAREVVP